MPIFYKMPNMLTDDKLNRWLADCCAAGGEASITDLWDSFRAWAALQPHEPFAPPVIRKHLRQALDQRFRRNGYAHWWRYTGVSLRDT